jgi:hypothetical protein
MMSKHVEIVPPLSANFNKKERRPQSASIYLASAISEVQIESEYRNISEVWGSIQIICQRLAFYITDILRLDILRPRHLTFYPDLIGSQGSLLAYCLEKGMYQYKHAQKLGATPVQCFIEFFKGLLEQIPVTMKYKVEVSKETANISRIWRPMDGPLSEWWQHHSAKPSVHFWHQSLVKSLLASHHQQMFSDDDIRRKILFYITDSRNMSILNSHIDYIVSSQHG